MTHATIRGGSFAAVLALILLLSGSSRAAVLGIYPSGAATGYDRVEVSRHLSEIMPEIGLGLAAAAGENGGSVGVSKRSGGETHMINVRGRMMW